MSVRSCSLRSEDTSPQRDRNQGRQLQYLREGTLLQDPHRLSTDLDMPLANFAVASSHEHIPRQGPSVAIRNGKHDDIRLRP